MSVLLGIVWLQLSPISTHRPTQGINAAIVEPGALQIESGYQPFWNSAGTLSQEGVVQMRMGLHRRWEGFLTVGISGPPYAALPLSLSVKGNVLQTERLMLSVVGWGYLPLAGHSAGGQIWVLGDWSLNAASVLSINLVGGYFEGGLQSFLTAFYTHALGERWAAWVEAFAYIPEAPGMEQGRYGAGTGIQRLFGAERRTAIDLAVNGSLRGNVQILLGLSRKARALHRQ